MRSTLKKINPIVFVLIYSLTFIYVLFKIIHVPITHDEVATVVHYNNFSAWEIMMYPDPLPNNHILNTLSAKFCIFLFGPEQWAIRLPNLLSFILFGIGVYRILKTVISKESMFFIPAALLFIASPYLLDFFGLCRGYGMSAALCTLSVSYVLSGFANSNNKNIWYGFIISILACYANFTLLVFWAAITILTWFYFYSSYRIKQTKLLRHTLIIFLSSIAYLALIAGPLYKMQSTDQFEFWTSTGFFNETIIPLVMSSKYDSRIFITTEFIAWFSVGVLALNAIYVFVQFKKSNYDIRTFSRPIAVATMIILFTAGINILQVWILDTPNLTGRTALFFYPLFITALISSYEMFKQGKFTGVKIGFSILMTALLLHHVIHTMKPYSVRGWAYDANTLKVLNYFEDHRENQETSLATNWMFIPSFRFYNETGKAPWLDLKKYNTEIDPNLDVHYYYVFAEDYPLLESKFEPVLKFENNCWLLKAR